MMNPGKKFEQDFKKSVPDNVFFYRFRDGTANFQGQKNENVRFQQTNICDCMIFNGNKLFLLELKSFTGRSIPIKNIRENQLTGLLDASKYDNIIAGFIFNYRDYKRTYFIDVNHVKSYIESATNKSFNVNFVAHYGILIPLIRYRNTSRFAIDYLLTNYKKEMLL